MQSLTLSFLAFSDHDLKFTCKALIQNDESFMSDKAIVYSVSGGFHQMKSQW